jgi:hypothetical protein
MIRIIRVHLLSFVAFIGPSDKRRILLENSFPKILFTIIL